MSSDSNPNPRNPVNPTAEDPTPSEQQSDAVVSPEAGEESTESNGVVFRDSAGVGAGDSGDGAEGLKDRSSAVLEGSGELSGGDLGESGVVISEVDLGIDSGADVIGKLSGRRDSCGVLKELGSSGEAEESRELNSVVKEEIPRDLDTGVGEELGELRSIEVGDEVVEELVGGGNLDEVTEELGSSVQAEVDEETNDVNGAVSGDSATEIERELRESKKLGRVHLVSSGVELPAAHSQGDVKREGLGVEDNNVVDSRETGNLERDQKDFDSGIEAEVAAGTSELSGVILEEIPRDLATEVAEELKEPRQIGRVDLGKSDGETLAVDSQGSVSGNLRFGVASREQEFLEGEVVELRNSAEKGEMVFGRTCSELEVEEVPLSPNSSGYAGERGSSSSGGGGSETDEIQESRSVDFVEGDHGVSASGSQGSYGNGHKDEDDASISWRKRKKHFLILSHSGKPIFSRYGDEHKLAGFSATLQAIISFVENGRDRVKSVRAGNHQVVFLVKGPIYLVCISCTEEPYESLKEQLELLYGQMILILTKSVNKCFEKNSKFDMTPLLGGTDVVFSSLIHSFNWNPATFLHAYTCVPLPYATRQAVGAILQEIANSGILFSLIMCKHKVVSLAGAQKASLHPDDMLLLANFVVSSESFRTSEAFSPICLPRYNPFAFLHAYVHYFDEDIYLMMLTTSSNAFYHLKDCRLRIEEVLLKSNVLSEVHRSMMDGGMRIEDFPVDRLPRSRSLSHLGHHEVPSDSLERHRGPTSGFDDAAGLMHFMYRSIYLEQYVSSEFASPINSFPQQKRLYRAYQKLYLSVHHRETGPHKTHFRRDENYVLLCWVTQEFEFYAAFDPLADKAAAIKICNRVCQWVKDVETDIFLLGGNSFSW